MKAALVRRYGPPAAAVIEDVPRPEPGPGEILVRLRAATVSSADHRLRGADMPRGFGLPFRLIFGFTGPRRPVLGSEGTGVVEAVGAGVREWAEGDEIIVFAGTRLGLHAEFACLPATAAIARRPQAMGVAEAAALSFGGTTALYFLRDRAALQKGERVLVTGAGGAVGSAACQIAAADGGTVTAMCGAEKAAALRAIGIDDHIASGTRPPAGRQWDVIVDAAGIVSRPRAKAWLAPGGRLCQVLADLPQMLSGALLPLGAGRRTCSGTAPERRADVETLVALAEAGRYRPLIGAELPFAEIVRAHEIAASGHKLGSTVLVF